MSPQVGQRCVNGRLARTLRPTKFGICQTFVSFVSLWLGFCHSETADHPPLQSDRRTGGLRFCSACRRATGSPVKYVGAVSPSSLTRRNIGIYDSGAGGGRGGGRRVLFESCWHEYPQGGQAGSEPFKNPTYSCRASAWTKRQGYFFFLTIKHRRRFM